MSETFEFEQAEIDAIGAKLGSYDGEFTNRERALISAILARGLRALREDSDEMSGFAIYMRKAGGDPHTAITDGTSNTIMVSEMHQRALPTDQFSLNFAKIQF